MWDLLEGHSAQASLADAVVIFVADHGESAMEHERWFTHGYHVYQEIVRLPLVLQGPGLSPERVTTPVSIIDIVPSILRFAGAAAPEYLAGIDRPDREQGGRARPLFIEANLDEFQRRAVVESGGKWMLQYAQGSTKPNARLFYDLLPDPQERRPRPWPPASEGGRSLLNQARRDRHLTEGNATRRTGRRLEGPKIDPRADPEALGRLRVGLRRMVWRPSAFHAPHHRSISDPEGCAIFPARRVAEFGGTSDQCPRRSGGASSGSRCCWASSAAGPGMSDPRTSSSSRSTR